MEAPAGQNTRRSMAWHVRCEEGHAHEGGQACAWRGSLAPLVERLEQRLIPGEVGQLSLRNWDVGAAHIGLEVALAELREQAAEAVLHVALALEEGVHHRQQPRREEEPHSHKGVRQRACCHPRSPAAPGGPLPAPCTARDGLPEDLSSGSARWCTSKGTTEQTRNVCTTTTRSSQQ